MDGDDLILNGEIILEGAVLPHEWCELLEGGAFSARMVREALARFSGDVTVRVNSGGGDPYEGEAIRVALAAHPGRVRVIVGGIAASAASLMIMAGGRIEISAGSFIMIHDPASCMCGTATEYRREADRLDTLSETYAGVYAARSGQDRAAVLALMAEETWLGGEAAVESGFADALAEEARPEPETAPADLVAAQSMFADTIRTLRMCAEKFSVAERASATSPTASAGRNPARMATSEEVQMEPEEVTAEATPSTPPAPADPPPATPAPTTTMSADPDALHRRGVEAERARQRGIREMAAPFMASGQLTSAQVEAVIEEGTGLESAGTRFLAVMAAGEPPVTPTTGARSTVIRDETDTRMQGMIGALMREREGPAEQFRGLRLRSLAMELAGPSRGFNEADAIRRGMMATTMMGGAHGVSDFAYITTEVMNRSLIAAYERRAANWTAVTGTPVSAADFRELAPVRFGGDFQLKTVKANGEYEEAVLADEAEGLKVERRGRTINITFEAVVNDDMGAFTRIPGEFAMAARIMEASMVWTLIRTNAVLKSDSKALFHADHGNLAASGTVISATSVGGARKAMWEQRAFGTKDADDFMMVEADLLIVPPALETKAGQFVADITPAKETDANPFRRSLTPVVAAHLGAAAGGSDTAWYMVSSDLPPVTHAYLEGYEAPTVQTIEGMNPDKVTMNARHIFGAAVTEFRGSYKNPGS